MANITRKSKQNPWRNTREDYSLPWDEIRATILMVLLPIIIFAVSMNIVYRVEQFYSFYFSRTDIVKEVPYAVNADEMADLYARFMQHRLGYFQIKESNTYKPQFVFNLRDSQVMSTLRTGLDIILVIGFLAGIIFLVLFIQLYLKGEKKLLYRKFIDSHILFGAICFINLAISFVGPVKELLFRKAFGVRFPPGDVLIQLFEGGMSMYGGLAVTIVALIMLSIVWYIAKRTISRRKMFNKI